MNTTLHERSRTTTLLPTALSAAALLSLGCTMSSAEESTEGHEEELIGGTQAAEYHMRSTVRIGSCTGAKVGPRHFLLAAHCVDGDVGEVEYAYRPGRTFRVTNDIVLDGTETWSTLTIVRTTIHPSWTESCAGDCDGGNVLRAMKPADIAVIQVAETTDHIREARVDLSPIEPGTLVVKNGYGCEDRVGGDNFYTRRYKTHVTRVISSDQVLHAGSKIETAEDADAVGASYLVTAGRGMSASEASVCLGDSGGPLYRNDNTNLAVVGVNAFYTFPSPTTGISITDWHTRTSTRSRYNIGDWLRARGVSTTGGGVNEGSGRISLQRWNNVTGASIADIPVTQTPSLSTTLPQFELQSNIGDNYGVRVRGYLTAPATGTYRFWIAGDDQASLSLSTDSNAANKRRIAYHTGFTNSREWNKYSTQKSAGISLVAGRRYYIEALMKESGGGDNLAVGWLQPGQDGSAPLQVIPGYQLSPF